MCGSFVYAVYVLTDARWKKRKKKNKIEIFKFAFNFRHCEKKSCDSGAIFYVRIAKGFHV